MSGGIERIIIERILGIHELSLGITDELTEEQMTWFPSQTAPCIGWHFWHISRWADILQASNPGKDDAGSQIWHIEDVAAKWGLSPDTLGRYEVGPKMEPNIRLAEKGVLRDYGRRTFAAAKEVLADLEVHHFELPSQMRPSTKTTVGDDLLFYLTHASRHLGMIEALRGALGLQGTASV